MSVGKQVLCHRDAQVEEITAKKPSAAAGHHGSVLRELDFVFLSGTPGAL